MRAFILLLVIFFSMTAKSQTVEEKMRLALQLQEQKEYAKSNKHLIDLYSTNDLKELVCLNLAKNYFEIGNCKMAKKYASECIAGKGQYSKEAAIIKGSVLNKEKNYDEEEKLYNEILKLFPNDYDILYCQAVRISEQRPNEAGVEFYKTIKSNPLNRGMHWVIAEFEESRRHYAQCLLAEYFQMLTAPNIQSIKRIDRITKNRGIKDAMQQVLYSSDTITGKTENELFWAMAFIPDLEKCEISEDTQLPDAECFIDNCHEFLEKVCQSVTTNKNENERSSSDFYVDFFNNLLSNNMLDEYLYFVMIGAYTDINDYIPNMSKDRMNRFADFLEEYFKNPGQTVE